MSWHTKKGVLSTATTRKRGNIERVLGTELLKRGGGLGLSVGCVLPGKLNKVGLRCGHSPKRGGGLSCVPNLKGGIYHDTYLYWTYASASPPPPRDLASQVSSHFLNIDYMEVIH